MLIRPLLALLTPRRPRHYYRRCEHSGRTFGAVWPHRVLRERTESDLLSFQRPTVEKTVAPGARRHAEAAEFLLRL